MPESLVASCRRIEENCLYTSQTHFDMASREAKRARFWLQLLPSLVSASSGLLVAVGCVKPWVAAFAALAGAVSGVAAFLGVEKDATAHEVAGKLLTQLRHEARAARDACLSTLAPGQVEAQVLALEHRYSAYVASLPLTDSATFERVRARIKSGTFAYDSELSPAATSLASSTSIASQSSDAQAHPGSS